MLQGVDGNRLDASQEPPLEEEWHADQQGAGADHTLPTMHSINQAQRANFHIFRGIQSGELCVVS